MRKLVKLIIILKNMKECNQGYLEKNSGILILMEENVVKSHIGEDCFSVCGGSALQITQP